MTWQERALALLGEGCRLDRAADLAGVRRIDVIRLAHAHGYRFTDSGVPHWIGAPPVQSATASRDPVELVRPFTRHRSRRIARTAAKALAACEQLAAQVAEFNRVEHAKAAEAAAKRAAQARTKVLASELAAAQRAAGQPGVDTRAVRAWAKGAGYPLGDRGRIPRDVVAAYLSRGQGAA